MMKKSIDLRLIDDKIKELRDDKNELQEFFEVIEPGWLKFPVELNLLLDLIDEKLELLSDCDNERDLLNIINYKNIKRDKDI